MTNSHLDPRSVAAPGIPVTYHRTSAIDGLDIFYREAGPAGAPVVLQATAVGQIMTQAGDAAGAIT